jgi:colicin import membrane protein
MSTQLTIIDPKEFGLEESKAVELTSGLKNILSEREVLIDAYNDVITLEINTENLKTFKELRLQIRDNRTKGIEKWHKVNKEFFLTGGRFVDAIKNKEVAENERMEEKLLAAEKHFENLELERLTQVRLVREQAIAPFGYDFSKVDLSGMDEKMFDMILTGAQKTHEDKLAAEKLAEEQKIAEEKAKQEAIEAQKLENEKLKKEAEILEKELKAEKDKADAELAEQKRVADLEAKKQADLLAKQKAESDAILKKEQEAKAKLEAELKAKADAEALAKKKAEDENKAKLAAELKAAKAPKKEKLNIWINSLNLVSPLNLENDETVLEISEKFEAFKKWAKSKVDSI